MKWTPWQIIALVVVVSLSTQAPMYALASSIDNDEIAKSLLGMLVTGFSAALFSFVLKVMRRRPNGDQEE